MQVNGCEGYLIEITLHIYIYQRRWTNCRIKIERNLLSRVKINPKMHYPDLLKIVNQIFLQ